jgi:3-isopropylmalate/(R)-2-methylmalate dehydratase large subunit
MGMTVTEKIISRHSGGGTVRPGDLLVVDVDLACIDDVQFFILEQKLQELGGKIRHPERVVLMADHYLPPAGADEAEVVHALAAFGGDRGLRTFVRDGVKHPVFIEQRLIRPGQILVATDSHTNTAGAVACFGIALGPSDVASVFATGKTWLKVPPTIRFEITGQIPTWVAAMDIGLTLLGNYGREFANYKTIEWGGEAVTNMPLPGRMTLCNLTTEFGAKSGIVEADQTTTAWAPPNDDGDEWPVSDADASYEAVHVHDAATFQPMIAAPPNPANVHPISTYAGTKVNQAYIGTCTHGTLEDLQAAASILRNRRVAKTTRLLVTPATQHVYDSALHDGTLAVLSEAGATICAPGCGSCFGVHGGTLAAGEVRISTQNRNFVGRSGHPTSSVFLASPMTVAAAAVAGEIVHPGELAS